MFIGFILPLIVTIKYDLNKNITLFTIITFLFLIFSYFLNRNLGLRPIKVYFNNEKIVFQYLAKNLKTIKREKTISMKYVRGFSDFTFGNHEIFKLLLYHNTAFSISKNGFFYKDDDFEILTNDFKNFIKIHNNFEKGGEDLINQKIKYNDFFQTKKATILFYVAILMGIWAIFITLAGKSHSLSGSMIAIGGTLGYIGTYLAKKNKPYGEAIVLKYYN